MAYTFTKKPFVWNKEGVDPTTSESELGLQGGMALPATFINQQWTKTYKAISEIQDVIESGVVADAVDGIFPESINVGAGNTLSGTYNCTVGYDLKANGLNSVFGKHCKTPTASSTASNTGDLLIVGNGVDGGAKSNALRITAGGDVMGVKAYASSGADVTHLTEWLDGNPDNEDRRGFFVTLVGKKMRKATSQDDYIAGVVSATPSLVCNAFSDDWHGKYVTDEFGARVTDENGAWVISDDFDESLDESYESRIKRPEWGLIGHSGYVVARDDGTCEVDSYCLPNDNGVATKATTGYRVMERVSNDKILINVSAPLIINK